jgi:hypothetical protein
VNLLSPSRAALGASEQHSVSVVNRSATTERRSLTVAFAGGAAQTVVSVSTPQSSAWTCVLDTEARCTWSGGLAPVYADGAVVTSATAETILG